MQYILYRLLNSSLKHPFYDICVSPRNFVTSETFQSCWSAICFFSDEIPFLAPVNCVKALTDRKLLNFYENDK